MKDNSCRDIKLITRFVAGGWLAAMAFCPQLWRSDRIFPRTPAFSALPDLPESITLPLIILLASSLIFTLVRPSRIPVIAATTLAIIIALFDMNRWQPWFYQYLLTFFVLCFFDFRCDSPFQQKSILQLFRYMVAAIYIWSGLQKLNPNFATDTFPWLMEPFTRHMEGDGLSRIAFLANIFPFVETGMGILLLIPAVRRAGVVMAIFMHILILVILSPWGQNYNMVVWPWNIVMMAQVLILFHSSDSWAFRDTIKYSWAKIVFALFVLMPLFNFFNAWDSYLSHNLYSGNTSGGEIQMSESMYLKLPPEIQQHALDDGTSYILNIKYWCMQETGVPAYPEDRNFRQVVNYVARYADDESQFYYTFTPKLKAGQ
jgi:uncharacterized membrane protein YphA (DoxX/SURF4 family)